MAAGMAHGVLVERGLAIEKGERGLRPARLPCGCCPVRHIARLHSEWTVRRFARWMSAKTAIEAARGFALPLQPLE